MPVTHVNRKRDTYYLHAGKTKTDVTDKIERPFILIGRS